MIKRFINQNVKLSWLADKIVNFLEQHNFEMIFGELPDNEGFQIIAYNSPSLKIKGYLEITVKGADSNFTIDFNFQDKSGGLKPIFLTTMFGFGYTLLQRLKANDTLTKIEKEFWRYIDSVLIF
jgi:hypothetical protein